MRGGSLRRSRFYQSKDRLKEKNFSFGNHSVIKAILQKRLGGKSFHQENREGVNLVEVSGRGHKVSGVLGSSKDCVDLEGHPEEVFAFFFSHRIPHLNGGPEKRGVFRRQKRPLCVLARTTKKIRHHPEKSMFVGSRKLKHGKPGKGEY